MKKAVILLVTALLSSNANAQLPPPKPISPEEQQSDQLQIEQAPPEAQPEQVPPEGQPQQQTLPPPKPVTQDGRPVPGGKSIYVIMPFGKNVYVMIDPNKGRHPCVGNSDKAIVCRW